MRVTLRNGLMLGYGLMTRPFQANRGKRVVAFHEVKDRSLFRAKLEWLKENYEIVALHELLRREPSDRIMISLTFDDGYQCWRDEAAPILGDLGLHAVFFVCSGLVGLRDPQAARFFRERVRRREELRPLTLSGLKDIANHSKFEIGSHTCSHVDFSRVSGASVLENEIKKDVVQLQEWTGTRIRFFAYPFGGWPQISAVARRYIQQEGFEAAFSIIPGFLTPETDRSAVGRDCLDVREPCFVWKSWLGGGYDAYHALKGERWKRRTGVA